MDPVWTPLHTAGAAFVGSGPEGAAPGPARVNAVLQHRARHSSPPGGDALSLFSGRREKRYTEHPSPVDRVGAVPFDTARDVPVSWRAARRQLCRPNMSSDPAPRSPRLADCT